jgi:hypothetical protein
MADEAEMHLSPGARSLQLDADFADFSACLADDMSSMRLSGTYPEAISPEDSRIAAEHQLQACSPFDQTRSNRMVDFVSRLLQHFLPRH